jgi:hypothetical protein
VSETKHDGRTARAQLITAWYDLTGARHVHWGRGMRYTVILFALAAASCVGPFRCSMDDDDPQDPPDLATNADLSPCTKCGNECVDIYSDPRHCGGCGIACASGMCVKAMNGLPFCSCDTDGGVPGCSSPAAPLCNDNGLCTCGGSESGICNPKYGDSCKSGACTCGNEPACTTLASNCNPSLSPSCRCGNGPACDKDTANRCDTTKSPSCRCGNAAACAAGTTCCTQNSTCCQPGQYCCIDGCCNHPCLAFGFCG